VSAPRCSRRGTTLSGLRSYRRRSCLEKSSVTCPSFFGCSGYPGCGRPLDAYACDLNRANSRERPNQFTTSAPSPKFGSQHGMENQMSDPRYQDRVNDPRPLPRGSSDYVEDDTRRGAMWAWIAGIIAVIFVAMLVYGYTRPDTTTASTPMSSSSSTTTGAGPAPRVTPPAPATPAPATPTPATPSPGGNP
jgi:hypothetical protein